MGGKARSVASSELRRSPKDASESGRVSGDESIRFLCGQCGTAQQILVDCRRLMGIMEEGLQRMREKAGKALGGLGSGYMTDVCSKQAKVNQKQAAMNDQSALVSGRIRTDDWRLNDRMNRMMRRQLTKGRKGKGRTLCEVRARQGKARHRHKHRARTKRRGVTAGAVFTLFTLFGIRTMSRKQVQNRQ